MAILFLPIMYFGFIAFLLLLKHSVLVKIKAPPSSKLRFKAPLANFKLSGWTSSHQRWNRSRHGIFSDSTLAPGLQAFFSLRSS